MGHQTGVKRPQGMGWDGLSLLLLDPVFGHVSDPIMSPLPSMMAFLSPRLLGNPVFALPACLFVPS